MDVTGSGTNINLRFPMTSSCFSLDKILNKKPLQSYFITFQEKLSLQFEAIPIQFTKTIWSKEMQIKQDKIQWPYISVASMFASTNQCIYISYVMIHVYTDDAILINDIGCIEAVHSPQVS